MSYGRKKYRVQGISFPNEYLYQSALKKAAAQRRSLSNYICGLIEQDLLKPLKFYPPLDQGGAEKLNEEPSVNSHPERTSDKEPGDTPQNSGEIPIKGLAHDVDIAARKLKKQSGQPPHAPPGSTQGKSRPKN